MSNPFDARPQAAEAVEPLGTKGVVSAEATLAGRAADLAPGHEFDSVATIAI